VTVGLYEVARTERASGWGVFIFARGRPKNGTASLWTHGEAGRSAGHGRPILDLPPGQHGHLMYSDTKFRPDEMKRDCPQTQSPANDFGQEGHPSRGWLMNKARPKRVRPTLHPDPASGSGTGARVGPIGRGSSGPSTAISPAPTSMSSTPRSCRTWTVYDQTGGLETYKRDERPGQVSSTTSGHGGRGSATASLVSGPAAWVRGTGLQASGGSLAVFNDVRIKFLSQQGVGTGGGAAGSAVTSNRLRVRLRMFNHRPGGAVRIPNGKTGRVA